MVKVKKYALTALTAAALLVSGEQSFADFVSISVTSSVVNATQQASGAPAGWRVYDFYVSTDADILSIENVRTIGSYNDPLGSDTEESPFSGVPGFERLQVDSWITTPGNTTILGGDGALDADGTESWTDLTDDGPQNDFLFARLTLDPPLELVLSSGR